jgi:hypothetical protein
VAQFISHIMSAASGSVGGVSFQKGLHSSITARARSKTKNSETPAQIRQRRAFKYATTSWDAYLSQSDRAAWDLYAQNVTLFNRVGEPFRPTGQLCWVRWCTLYYQAVMFLDVPLRPRKTPPAHPGPVVFNKLLVIPHDGVPFVATDRTPAQDVQQITVCSLPVSRGAFHPAPRWNPSTYYVQRLDPGDGYFHAFPYTLNPGRYCIRFTAHTFRLNSDWSGMVSAPRLVWFTVP